MMITILVAVFTIIVIVMVCAGAVIMGIDFLLNEPDGD